NPIRSTTAPSADIENERQAPDPQALTGQRRKRDGRSLTRPREAAMSIAEVPTNATSDTSVARVDMKLETVVIPVSDVDRAKEFYGSLGWRLDADLGKDDFRVVQFTPPGSGCSIQFGAGLTSAAPGAAQGLLVVSDR